MTAQEAHKILHPDTSRDEIMKIEYYAGFRAEEAGLKAVQEACLVACEALEKQIPKKPLYKQGTRYKWIDTIRERGRYHNVEKWSNRDACPNCKKDILQTNYCEECGQKLDWGEQNDQT